MDNCAICKKHEKITELMIYKDDFVYVSHYLPDVEGNTNYLGYYFVEMNRHFDGIQNATNQELDAMIMITKHLANALIEKFGGERIYTFITGDGVKHMHEHVVIKHTGTPREFKACKVDEWPEAPRGDYDDVVTLNKEIIRIMNNN